MDLFEFVFYFAFQMVFILILIIKISKSIAKVFVHYLTRKFVYHEKFDFNEVYKYIGLYIKQFILYLIMIFNNFLIQNNRTLKPEYFIF